MTSGMTQLTKRAYDQAISEDLTVQEAVMFLERESRIRTLREKLERFYRGEDLQRTLVEGLLADHPDAKRESAERRVRNWLGDGTRTLRKQDAIEICYILSLSVEDANRLVAMVSEEALHWRNPDEIVFIFGLEHGMKYSEAEALNDRIGKKLQKEEKKKEERQIPENGFTKVIRGEVSALRTAEELEDYLRQELPRFGRCHNKAYRLFEEMMEELEHPAMDEGMKETGLFEPEKLTVRDILREYFYQNNVLHAKHEVREKRKRGREPGEEEKRVFSVVQENISAGWPDETTLSKMRSRKTDVTRKVLILLFLATDQGVAMPENLSYAPTRDELFEDLYQRLNDMLDECGFQELDPRSPFDWIMIYCMCVDDMFDLDVRMKAIFREMFGEKTEEEQEVWTKEPY